MTQANTGWWMKNLDMAAQSFFAASPPCVPACGCAAAVVDESVPADRARREWVLARAERNAETWARVRVDVRLGEPARVPAARRPAFALRGVLHTGRAAARAAVAALRHEEAALARAQTELAGGRGIVRGALGITREEYARTS